MACGGVGFGGDFSFDNVSGGGFGMGGGCLGMGGGGFGNGGGVGFGVEEG